MATVSSNPLSRSSVWVSEAASVASADYVPLTGAFRALNCSVAGLLLIKKGDQTSVVEYLNTGWNPTAGVAVIKDNGNTATLVAAAIDR